MLVHPAARRHGIADEDIVHAVEHALATDYLADDRWLYIGPARDATPLEVVLVRHRGEPDMAIHAMRMRRKYLRLLRGH